MKITYKGRTGNQILMYLMGQYIAEKYDIVTAASDDFEDQHLMELEKFLGKRSYDTIREINDENIEEFLQNKSIDYDVHLNGFFQSPVILGNPEIQQCYRRYMHPRPSPVDKDLFVHVRLGDITNLNSLPYAYYYNSIKQVQFSSGVISSDSPNSDLVQQLAAEFNLDILEGFSPVGTICYGSQFKNLVLSAGTFSFLTAFYAAPDANIWYIDNPTQSSCFNVAPWGPDIFSIFANQQRSHPYANTY
jgi:hypothetical protein